MKFAVSLLVVRTTVDGMMTNNLNRHGFMIVEGDNIDEATGKALRICHHLFPESEGWTPRQPRSNTQRQQKDNVVSLESMVGINDK